MKRPLIIVLTLVALVVGFAVWKRPRTLSEDQVPDSVKAAAYSKLIDLGCKRKTDGTWDCPEGALH